MAMPVITGYSEPMGARAERKAFYGIAEIADALGLNRQLVTAWRRRRSHGIPEPDGELSSGPIWRGTTIEPWIDVVRATAGFAGAADQSRARVEGGSADAPGRRAVA